MIIGCSIFAVLLIIGVIRCTLNMKAKEKEAKAKEEETIAKEKEIERLTKEVDRWEQKVKFAFGNASSILPKYKQSDFLTGVAFKKTLLDTIVKQTDESSLEEVEILIKSGANLLLRKLHLYVLKDDDTAEQWNSPATFAKLLYQCAFLWRMDLRSASEKDQQAASKHGVEFLSSILMLDKFWKDSFKNIKLGKEMKQFLEECAAWLEGYIDAFKWALFTNPDIDERKAELEAIKSLLKE